MELRDRNGLTEKEFFEDYKTHNYPKPALSADIAIFGKTGDVFKILLIKRGGHPFIGKWALPGGFTEPDEPSETTAERELQEETSLTGIPLFPVGFYSAPGRDPRCWTVSMAYTALIDIDQYQPKAGDDAADARWFEILKDENGQILFSSLEKENLAFDHYNIITDAFNTILRRLRHKHL